MFAGGLSDRILHQPVETDRLPSVFGYRRYERIVRRMHGDRHLHKENV